MMGILVVTTNAARQSSHLPRPVANRKNEAAVHRYQYKPDPNLDPPTGKLRKECSFAENVHSMSCAVMQNHFRESFRGRAKPSLRQPFSSRTAHQYRVGLEAFHTPVELLNLLHRCFRHAVVTPGDNLRKQTNQTGSVPAAHSRHQRLAPARPLHFAEQGPLVPVGPQSSCGQSVPISKTDSPAAITRSAARAIRSPRSLHPGQPSALPWVRRMVCHRESVAGGVTHNSTGPTCNLRLHAGYVLTNAAPDRRHLAAQGRNQPGLGQNQPAALWQRQQWHRFHW